MVFSKWAPKGLGLALCLLASGIVAFGGMPAFAAPPPSVKVKIDTGPKTTPGNVPGDTTGDAVHYAYVINANTSISDSIPIKICLTYQEPDWTSFAIHIGVLGIGNLPGVTLPGDIVFTNTGSLYCKTTSIQIDSGPLAVGNYAVNVNMTVVDKEPRNMQVGLNEGTQTIHIKASALSAGKNVSCFLTDSSGNLLSNCTGEAVTASESSDGRFVIVVNKKNIEVATNPGQFYYNLVWRNTTSVAQTVHAIFERTGVAPKGAQALHAAVFNAYLSTITPSEFDATNEIGIPDGSDDSLRNISVPAGSSLVVTYHLEWTGVGNSAPLNCGTTCATANQHMKVVGTVEGTYVDPLSCTTEAYGWKKVEAARRLVSCQHA